MHQKEKNYALLAHEADHFFEKNLQSTIQSNLVFSFSDTLFNVFVAKFGTISIHS